MPSKLPTCKPYDCKKPYSGGKCRGLFIGINYTGTDAELNGCVNDVSDILGLLEHMNFPLQEAVILVDDARFPSNSGMPTHDNILMGLRWLTQGAAKGDMFFLHFSGHGTQVTAEMKDAIGKSAEADGLDEAIVPLDYMDAGLILDDTIFTYAARTVPAGARLTALLDCCHSGTMMDLPFVFTCGDESTGGSSISYSPSTTNMVAGDVVMISGCADAQTSSDVVGSNFTTTSSSPGRAGGACTGALQDVILRWSSKKDDGSQRKLTFAEVLKEMRTELKTRGFSQIPQLSCSKVLKPDALFDLRSPSIVTEDLSKVENVCVEVTTTVKPSAVAVDPIVAQSGVVPTTSSNGTTLAASYTPYTFTLTYPYSTSNGPATKPSDYWYYDPALGLAAAAADAHSDDEKTAFAAIAAAGNQGSVDHDALYAAIPEAIANTVTIVDSIDELDEDPADVGGKTVAELLSEMPCPPSAVVVLSEETSMEFEPLFEDDDEDSQAASATTLSIKPSEWKQHAQHLAKPGTYSDFRRRKDEKYEKSGRRPQRHGGGFGAGNPHFFSLVGHGSYGSVPSRGYQRANGHGSRVGLPPSAFAAPFKGGNVQNSSILSHALGGQGFGRKGYGVGGDDRGRQRKMRMANEGHSGRGPRMGGFRGANQRGGPHLTLDRHQPMMVSRGGHGRPESSYSHSPKGRLQHYGSGGNNSPSFFDRMGGMYTIPTDIDDLREVFATFDSDHNGLIDRDEFIDAMLLFQKEMGLTLTKDAIRRDFDKFDRNRDGRLAFDEFVVYMLKMARQ